jgi:hypothetical protein
MRKNPRLFRLSATVAIGALLCNAAVPVAMAQPAPPPPGQNVPADQNQADPPARVGRVASQSGAVSFRTSADTQWSAARANYPVSAGNAFWTEPTAQAELQISASRIDLAGQTEFDVTTLADSGLQAVVPQGELYVHLASLEPNEVWTVDTPRGTVRMTTSGRYHIVAGTTEQPTTVTVLEGSAQIEGPGVSLTVAANQTATVTGAGPSFQGNVGVAVRDGFLSARLAAERPPARAASIPAQYNYMSGAEDLSGVGEWSSDPDYGQVWYPPVAASWVPYRDGEWAYVQPWGWTWVDSDSWGFAPFHYGRWARIHDRWGWTPGEAGGGRDRPVYSPALVTFVGVAAGVAVGAAIAGRRSVGWVPLGPGEAYHPWYHASQGYLQRINAGHVKDPAAIGNSVAPRDFVNRAAATAVPASVMLGSRPVRQFAHPISAQTLAAEHPVVGEQPMRPTARTFGVTPAVAHQLNLPAAGAQAPHRPTPGPVVRVQESGPANGAPPRPPLLGPRGQPASGPQPGAPGGGPRPGEPAGAPRPGENPGGPRPGGPAAQGAAPGRPGGAPPPLEAPGARPQGVPGAGEARPGQPPGAHPPAPESAHPGGAVPLPAPGAHPPGVNEPRGAAPGGEAPGQHPPEARPANEARPEPGNRPPGATEAHPAAPPAAVREAPPHAAPEPARPAPQHEAPAARPVPPPHAEAPAARPAPPPHVEAPRPAPPPPHVEAPRPAPPPHVEAPRPAPPPPHPAAPPPAPRPAPPPPHPAAPPPAPHPAPPPPAKKPGEH